MWCLQVLGEQSLDRVKDKARLRDKNPPFAIIMFGAACIPGNVFDAVVQFMSVVKPLSSSLACVVLLQLASGVSAITFSIS